MRLQTLGKVDFDAEPLAMVDDFNSAPAINRRETTQSGASYEDNST